MKAKSNIHPHISGLVLLVVISRSPIKQDGFQILVDSGFSNHFVDSKLIRRIDNIMLDCTERHPPMEIKAAGHNTLLGTEQDILLVVGRDTQLCRAVKLPIVHVPGLERNLFSTALTAQKGVKTTFAKAGSIVDLSIFSIQLTRSDSLDHLDLDPFNDWGGGGDVIILSPFWEETARNSPYRIHI